MNEFDQEKFSLVSQINELYHIINLTQQNLTNTIHQVNRENLNNNKFLIIFYSYQTIINDYKKKLRG